MPRSLMQERLDQLLDSVRLLTSRVDNAIVDAMEALRSRDLNLARSVVEGDQAINDLRYEIEDGAIDLMALQAPVASDLREMVSILSIVADLERMGDYAEGLGRIALFLGDNPDATQEPTLWEMADIVRGMLRDATQSFFDRDEALARATCDVDDRVDRIYDDVHRHLIQRLADVAHNPQEFDNLTHVLWASHNLERIGDRATNICERAIYLVTGRLEEINVSRY